MELIPVRPRDTEVHLGLGASLVHYPGRYLGLAGFCRVLKSEITGTNGTTFIVAGIQQNISNIKPYESVDICWVEEAAKVSKFSWDVLIPTIRKESSEIWVSFNAEPATDRYV